MTITEIIKRALEDGKGQDIKILSVSRQSGGLFGWMMLVTANSPRHAVALSERVRKALKEESAPLGHTEASGDKSWVLVDAGDAVVHIMQAEARERYALESLWGFEEGSS